MNTYAFKSYRATDDEALAPDEQRLLLEVARESLVKWVHHQEQVDWRSFALTKTLHEHGGCFVTLRRGRELRGCIGSIAHVHPLARSVRDNAIGAASRDSRFPPIAPSELDGLNIEISALAKGDTPSSPFRRVRNLREIRIGLDGLYIEIAPNVHGVLLPQVAVDHSWDREQFLSATCIKAGADAWAWQRPGVLIYRFSAQVFGGDVL